MTRLEGRLAGAAGDASTPVCMDGNAVLTRLDLDRRTSAIGQALRETGTSHPVLATDDPFDFLAALIAAWECGLAAVIPSNFQPVTLAQHAAQGDVVIDATWLAARAPVAAAARAIAPDGEVRLQTSGSTGQPKIVPKSVGQLAAEIDVLEACWGAAIGPGVVLATVPHHHLYGLLFRVLWPFAAGRAFDRRACLDADQLHDAVHRHPAHVLVSSPAHLARLPDLTSLSSWMPRPRLVFSSGAPLERTTAALYLEALGAAPIEVLGSTESGGIASRQYRPDHADEWVPLPAVGVERDEDGALLVVSPWSGGPCRLEDAVEVNRDNSFRLGARMDRIVKLEGKRVSLPEIESVLARHAWVSAAAVEPLPEGGRLGAVLELTAAGVAAHARGGRAAVAGALREHLLTSADRVAVPRRFRIIDRLPRNERGKVDRLAVLRLLQKDDATPA